MTGFYGRTGNVTIVDTDPVVAIQSGGVGIGTVRTLNFVGTGNTFAVDGSRIDVSIAGGSGGGSGSNAGTVINYSNGTASPFILSIGRVTQSIDLDDTVAAEDSNIVVGGSTIVVDDGATVTVGEGKRVISDLYEVVGEGPTVQ